MSSRNRVLARIGRDAGTRGVQRLEAAELWDANRAQDVREAVVEPRLRDVEVAARGDAVVTEPAHRVGELRVGRRHCAALARRHDLARVKGEAAQDAERAARAAAVGGAESAGGVLDERDAVRHERRERVPVERPAEEVDGEHRLRPRREHRGQLRKVEVERPRIHVAEHRLRAAELDGVGRRRKRVGGNDDLVAGPDPKREHGEMERGGAGGDGDRVRHAAGRGDELLELGHL